MLAILQIFLLLFTSFLSHIGTTNPNFSSTGDYVPNEGFGFSFIVFFMPKVGHFLIWASSLYQALYLLLQSFLPSLVSMFFMNTSLVVNPLAFTYASILGFALMTIGSLGRILCHKTLGTYFTFELTIRNDHKLIKTGPYAYVRHPAYTFTVILVVGISLIHGRLMHLFSDKNWIRTMCSPMCFAAYGLVAILPIARRVKREEKELAKRFGKEWNEYASKTKMFIPKII